LLPEALLLASRSLNSPISTISLLHIPRQNTAPSHAGYISPRLSGGAKKSPVWRSTVNCRKSAGKEAILEQCSNSAYKGSHVHRCF
jgi:hypothetical protein